MNSEEETGKCTLGSRRGKGPGILGRIRRESRRVLRGALAQVVNNGLVQGRTTARTRVLKLRHNISREKDRIEPSVPVLL